MSASENEFAVDDVSVGDHLQGLSKAEESICEVLRIAAETCEGLQQLPFSDSSNLSVKADTMVNLLQDVRSQLVAAVNAIRPVEVQGSSNDSEIKAIEEILRAMGKD
jgi:hypothetical protein